MEESRSLVYSINFQSNAEQAESGVRSVMNSLGSLQNEISSTERNFGGLQNEVQGTSDNLGDLRSEVRSTVSNLGNLQSEADDAADSLGDIQDDADDAADSLDDLQDEAGSMGSAFRKSFLNSVDSGNTFASSLKQGVGGALTYVGGKANDFRENFSKTASNIGSSLAHPIQTIKGSLGNALQTAKSRFIDMARGAEEAEEETEDLGKTADSAEKDVDDLGNTAEKSGGKFEKFGNILKGVGVALVAATTAIGAFAASSVNVGMAFDSSMSQVAATMGYTVEELHTAGSEANKTYNELREFAMEMGATTAFSASQAADALNYMALAGYDADTSMSMLPTVLDLAAAGGIELAAASDMVTDAQSALGLSLDETSALVDKMAKASSKSNTSVEQLGSAILSIGGTAQNLAGGTTELSAALGILADNGIKGAEGGTHLRNIILSLASPSDTAAKAISKLGVEVFDAEGNMRPLNETLADMQDAMSDMSQGDKLSTISDIFNTTDIASVNALLGTSAERWDELYAAIDSAWYTSEGLNAEFKKYGTSLPAMASNLKKLGITQEEFDSALSKSGGSVTQFSEFLSEASDEAVSWGEISAVIGLSAEELETAFNGVSGAAKNMADTQLDNLEGDITMFKSALEGAQILVSDGLTPTLREFVQFGTNSISTLSTAFKEGGLSGAMSALGTVLSDGLGMVIEKLPEMIDAGMQLLGALGQGLLDNMPLIVDAAIQIVTSLGDGVLQALPKIAEAAVTVITTLANGIGSSLPTLIPTIVSTVITVANTLIQNLPLIIDAGMQIISGLAQGIIEAIPLLVEQLPELINQFVTFVTDNLPTIVEQGIQIIMTLADSIVSAIPMLIEQLPVLIISVVDFITENLPTIIEQGIQLVINLAMGLIEAIPILLSHLPEIISSIIGFLVDNLPMLVEAGISLVVQLAIGMVQAIPQLIAALPEIIGAVVEGLAQLPGMIFEIGGNLVKGLWEGIQSLAGWIWDQVSGWASSIWDGICGFFGIHSPSTEMAWVGEMLVEGLAGSIDKNGDEAVDAAVGMADSIMSAFDSMETDISPSIEAVSDISYGVTPMVESAEAPAVTDVSYGVTPVVESAEAPAVANVNYGVTPIVENAEVPTVAGVNYSVAPVVESAETPAVADVSYGVKAVVEEASAPVISDVSYDVKPNVEDAEASTVTDVSYGIAPIVEGAEIPAVSDISYGVIPVVESAEAPAVADVEDITYGVKAIVEDIEIPAVSDTTYGVKAVVEDFNPPDVSASAVYNSEAETVDKNTGNSTNGAETVGSEGVPAFSPIININVSGDMSEEGIGNISESLRETVRRLYMEFREEELERMALKQQYAF